MEPSQPTQQPPQDQAPQDAASVAAVPSWMAIYYDGETNVRREVRLKAGAGLEIVEAGFFLTAWSYGDIRRVDGPAGMLRLRDISARPLARLEIRDAATQAEVARLCPLLDGEGSPNDGSTLKIVFWSLASTVSIVGLVWFAIPFLAERLTPLVPVAVERRIGDATNSQVRRIFGDKVCDTPGGSAALTKLVTTMQAAADMRIEPRSAVLHSVIPNAFALPGDRVYVLSQLIDKAESPDELAGVLAHEFGHVAHRDGVRRIIADGSTSFLLGMLLGDITGGTVVLTAGRSLFAAAYSRDQEASADIFARDLMLKLGRSPKPLGDLMLRILGSEKANPLSIFASHPLTESRITMLSAPADVPEGPPLLSAGEWLELKAICK